VAYFAHGREMDSTPRSAMVAAADPHRVRRDFNRRVAPMPSSGTTPVRGVIAPISLRAWI